MCLTKPRSKQIIFSWFQRTKMCTHIKSFSQIWTSHICLWWLGFRFEPVFTTAPAALKVTQSAVFFLHTLAFYCMKKTFFWRQFQHINEVKKIKTKKLLFRILTCWLHSDSCFESRFRDKGGDGDPLSRNFRVFHFFLRSRSRGTTRSRLDLGSISSTIYE